MKTIFIIQAFHKENDKYILTLSEAFTVQKKADAYCLNMNNVAPDGIYYKVDMIFIYGDD